MTVLLKNRIKDSAFGLLLSLGVAAVLKIAGLSIEKYGTNFVVWRVLAIMIIMGLAYQIFVYSACAYAVKRLVKRLALPKDMIAEGIFVHHIPLAQAERMDQEEFFMRVMISRKAKEAGEALARVMKKIK